MGAITRQVIAISDVQFSQFAQAMLRFYNYAAEPRDYLRAFNIWIFHGDENPFSQQCDDKFLDWLNQKPRDSIFEEFAETLWEI